MEGEEDVGEKLVIKIVTVGSHRDSKVLFLETYDYYLSNTCPEPNAFIFAPELEYIPTFFDNAEYDIQIDNRAICLSVWDGGMESHKTARWLSYKKADAIFITFNLTDGNSYEQLEDFWIPDILESGVSANLTVVEVYGRHGEESEGEDEDSGVTTEQAIEMTSKYGLEYARCVTMYDTKELFENTIKGILTAKYPRDPKRKLTKARSSRRVWAKLKKSKQDKPTEEKEKEVQPKPKENEIVKEAKAKDLKAKEKDKEKEKEKEKEVKAKEKVRRETTKKKKEDNRVEEALMKLEKLEQEKEAMAKDFEERLKQKDERIESLRRQNEAMRQRLEMIEASERQRKKSKRKSVSSIVYHTSSSTDFSKESNTDTITIDQQEKKGIKKKKGAKKEKKQKKKKTPAQDNKEVTEEKTTTKNAEEVSELVHNERKTKDEKKKTVMEKPEEVSKPTRKQEIAKQEEIKTTTKAKVNDIQGEVYLLNNTQATANSPGLGNMIQELETMMYEVSVKQREMTQQQQQPIKVTEVNSYVNDIFANDVSVCSEEHQQQLFSEIEEEIEKLSRGAGLPLYLDVGMLGEMEGERTEVLVGLEAPLDGPLMLQLPPPPPQPEEEEETQGN